MESRLIVGGCGIMPAVTMVNVSADQRRELERIVSRTIQRGGLGPTSAGDLMERFGLGLKRCWGPGGRAGATVT
jgi:hypothetical protein